MDEITAEFKTAAVQQTAESLNVSSSNARRRSKSSLPVAVGLLTMLTMAVICYLFWSR